MKYVPGLLNPGPVPARLTKYYCPIKIDLQQASEKRQLVPMKSGLRKLDLKAKEKQAPSVE